jgi:hypothetical protein
MIGNAMAGDLFGGPVFSGNQSIIACEIVNVSNVPVNISAQSIFDKSGVNLPFNGNTCGSTLPAFQACFYFVSGLTGGTGVHTCFIRIVEPNARVRGTAHARNSSNNTISESQMR